MKTQQLKPTLKIHGVMVMMVRLSFMVLLGTELVACGGGGGGDSSAPPAGTDTSVAAKTSMIPSGDATCTYGGILVETGIDENRNGVLDASEVDTSEKVCNGAPGDESLIDINPEPVGVNCPNGGLRVDVGIDSNSNANLDPAEITQTGYVCSGTDGSIGWQVATLIEANNTGDVLVPQVAVDDAGNAVAVWQMWNNVTTNYDLWFNRYVPSIGWGSAELLVASALAPQVAMDAGGNAIVVWHQWDGARDNIWSNRYVPGVGWGTAELIETDNAGSAYKPQVAVDTSGNAVVVWHQFDGTRYNIWSNRYVSGAGWGTAELIETDNGSASGSQVAVDIGGNAVAVWNQSDGTRNNIWSNRYVPGVGWGTAELIETDNAGDAYFPQVTMGVGGNAMVVWEQSDGTHPNIWSNRYVPGVGWSTAELIETDNAGDAYYPQVATDTGGNVVAVWYQFDGARSNIWSNRYTSGTGWGTAELIETDNAGSATYPQVAVDVNGNAVAVWYQNDRTRYNIWSNRYVPGAGWGSAQLIENDNAGSASRPQVAMDGSGNAVAVWVQSDGTLTNIWSNRWLAP